MHLKDYIAIARPDHWFKNVFMLLGIVLAFFIEPKLIHTNFLLPLLFDVGCV